MTTETFTTDPTLARQESLNLSPPARAIVLGCGGVGSWLAYFLALAGVNDILLFDSDTISQSNLNRLPVPHDSVGRLKTDATRDLILRSRPHCRVTCYPNFTSSFADALRLVDDLNRDRSNEEYGGHYIIATTDSLASRQEAHYWATNHYFSYVEAAAEGEFGSCAGEPADFATPLETHPGYQSVPVWVGPCVMAAALACGHILHGGPDSERINERIGFEVPGDLTASRLSHPGFNFQSTILRQETPPVADASRYDPAIAGWQPGIGDLAALRQTITIRHGTTPEMMIPVDTERDTHAEAARLGYGITIPPNPTMEGITEAGLAAIRARREALAATSLERQLTADFQELEEEEDGDDNGDSDTDSDTDEL